MKQRLFLIMFIGFASFSQICGIDTRVKQLNSDISLLRSQVAALVEQEKKIAPDIKRKEQECVELVEHGAQYLIEKNLEIAIDEFINVNKWRRGEIFLFVLDDEGSVVCHGENSNLLWRKIDSAPNRTGGQIFEFIKTTDEKGKWINYAWNNGDKKTYVKKISLNKTHYYIGAGYFPQSKEHFVEQLVKSAIEYFKEVPAKVAFTRISNPNDIFLVGDVQVYVMDKTGLVVANSFDQSFIGQNFNASPDGITAGIFKAMRGVKGSKVLMNYWKNLRQYNYIEKYYDPRSKMEYYFVGTFITVVNENNAVDLIEKGENHIKAVGPEQAYKDFSKPHGDFEIGDLTLSVFDFEGNNLANGQFPRLIGQNLINHKDARGKLVIKEIIEAAKKIGFGVMQTYSRNSNERIIFKKVSTPTGDVILTSSIYAYSKLTIAESFVDQARVYLQENSIVNFANIASSPKEKFYHGYIYTFMYNSEGIPLVNGEYKNTIWADTRKIKDDKGNRIVQDLMKFANQGGGWYSYNTRNAKRNVFVKKIVLNNSFTNKPESFYLGSGFFA